MIAHNEKWNTKKYEGCPSAYTLLLLCSAMTVFAQKTSFSGNWIINKDKMDFGQAPEWVIPKNIKVEQGADKLTLTRISLDQSLAEQAPITETLAFNGKPFLRTPASGPLVTTTLHWLNDQSFTLVRKGTSIVTEIWTLEDGGKTLVVNRDVTQDNGLKYNLRCYYTIQ